MLLNLRMLLIEFYLLLLFIIVSFPKLLNMYQNSFHKSLYQNFSYEVVKISQATN